MRARAPGKVVLSGAYAVLDGAPAIVAAVDRYAVADSSRPPNFVSDEVRAALGERAAPHIDASALRHGERKLGLGSSAAILVASLAALELERDPDLEHLDLVGRVIEPSLLAHASAQAGGSGIDVAASAYGGVILARRVATGLEVSSFGLPPGLEITVFALGSSASTPGLIARVRALESADPARYERLMGAQSEAAERAAHALEIADGPGLLRALGDQGLALRELGRAAGAPIVTPEIEQLREYAAAVGAAALPAGAGGGDIALWVTREGARALPPPIAGLEPLALSLGAPGVCRIE
jgi:phosphomevalonate kinase